MSLWYCEVGIQVWRREILVRAGQHLFAVRRKRASLRDWSASLQKRRTLSIKRSAATVRWRDEILRHLVEVWRKSTHAERVMKHTTMKVVARMMKGRQGAAFNRWQEHVLEVARQKSILRKVALQWCWPA
jgi:hypothetical protein